MSIWNDPEISFEQFAKYLCDDKNKATLKKIWKQKTKNKEFLSELENHELADILVSFEKECILSYNGNSGVSSDQLQDSSHLLSDWIFENKLSGIPSSDDEDYNTMKLSEIFNNYNFLFNWISQSCVPLKTYINSKNAHDPSLSQQEITAKNKRIVQKHPSLAHLFQQKIVNLHEFNEYKETQKQKQREKYDKKHENANENIHQLRKSRAMLFFNHSDIGYETKEKCKIYKNQKLTQLLIEVAKGELFGGKAQNKQNEIIHIIEPIKGYIHSKYVKIFDLDSAQWKFLQHSRTATAAHSDSLALRLNNEDLLLPPDGDIDIDYETKVQFKPYNENEDEKKLEEVENNNNINIINNMSLKEKRLIACKENAKNILNIEKSSRMARDVVTLWLSGFNLHDLDILKECYNPQVTSQQFVNQELTARDPTLQCLKQMFDASDDVAIDVTNIIVKEGNVILEFTTFGTRKENNSNSNSSDNLLGSHPTKNGLPQKIINGVGIFNVNNGEIMNQRLFWDQDQQWFTDMDVIKMPHSSSLSHFLYKNKLAPVLNLSDENLDNANDGNAENKNEAILHGDAGAVNQDALDGDDNIIYEMDDAMSEILALRGLNISDLRPYENQKQYRLRNKQKQLAQAIFWIAVGAMFVFVVPKYLGKPRR